MSVRYRCRHCEVEIGTLPFDADDTIRKLHIFELGEADDYVEKDQHGHTTVHCICEQCEDSLKQYPDYHALNKWIQ
ncbi:MULTISPECIES: anti-sigma-F factor Fin [Lysinibacillus]|jgi:hypothetical protein|uniref:DUF2757 domain-containing protein n=1 Tax=Lysinibacillus xylanilyticus TaxID=582475 RepID=A0A0K9F915_9BACI|nr:anti-sigma-F factor Fin [Lysinibacillus xylanilyticus]KMY30693.1 hypothetical protein ACZ11_14985 [Lysinibacillus xylanilyticus]PJO40153.1 DUF2757 domain-containing protein [Lysinibacillus xylanilyticus]PJO44293.1 DUF2757 domain-containing protein [Lysinibacillus xylanilyticus]QPQ32914.1 DUF2757 family protein [Lysinibacillus sp. JNUCC-51]